jgi:hypothetical protein
MKTNTVSLMMQLELVIVRVLAADDGLLSLHL